MENERRSKKVRSEGGSARQVRAMSSPPMGPITPSNGAPTATTTTIPAPHPSITVLIFIGILFYVFGYLFKCNINNEYGFKKHHGWIINKVVYNLVVVIKQQI